MPRCDITPKALIAYEEFLRLIDLHPKRYNAKSHKAFHEKLTSFIGENGQYSVLGKSDNRRTSKMSAPGEEREKVPFTLVINTLYIVRKLMLDVMVTKIRRPQRLFRNQLQILMTLPQQEVDAHENRQGFIVSSVVLLFEEQDVEMLHCRECKCLLHRHD